MSAITKAAGVSKATVYNHFPSKAELFGAYVQRECERSVIHVFDQLPALAEPAAALREIGRRMVGLMLSPAGLTIDRVVVSEAGAFPELAEVFFRAGPARGIAVMSAWIRKQTKDGRLDVEDPDFAAEQFFMLCQTRVVMRRRLRLTHAESPEAVNAVVDAAVDMFLRRYTSSD